MVQSTPYLLLLADLEGHATWPSYPFALGGVCMTVMMASSWVMVSDPGVRVVFSGMGHDSNGL